MTILFANLGTSDISVKIDGYYIPFFDRQEPNIVKPELAELKKIWDDRSHWISQYCEEELQISANEKFNFREVTKRLVEKYDQVSEVIHINRILGVIQKSAEISKIVNPQQSLKIYLFLTNQLPENPLDTLYAYDIVEQYLQKYAEQYLNTHWELSKIIIPPEISVAQFDEDKILNFYLETISKLHDGRELMLLNVKGGTPYMQRALLLQGLAMGLRQQVFIEPQFNVEKVLMGEPSECRLISYWRSQKQRELQTISKLLERWDFDGVRVILGDWRKNLKSLQTIDLPDSDKLSESLSIVDAMERETQMALDCWQLDFGDARIKAAGLTNEAKKDQYLGLMGELSDSQLTPNQLLLFNLYAQSKISFKCNEIVRFIYGFSTFHEVAQLESIVKLSPVDSLREGDWGYNLMIEHWSNSQKQSLKKKLSNSDKLSQEEIDNFRRFIPLKNRIIRSCVIRALTNQENQAVSTIQFFDNLDFWYDKRNKLVHAGDGISQDRIVKLHLERDEKEYTQACKYENIVLTMEKILVRLYGEALFKSKNLDGYFIYDQARDSINDLMGLF